MFIKEASDKSGLSIDTIRYYEKEHMLPKIARNQSGQRIFSNDNIEWLNLLSCLRKTGMPTNAMKRYALAVHDSENTIPIRIEILQEHQKLVAERRKDLDTCSAILQSKLRNYYAHEKAVSQTLGKTVSQTVD